MSDQLEQAIQSLEQVQQLDAQQVGRADTLGRAFELTAAVPPLARVIGLFSQISSSSLQDLGQAQRSQIQSQADQTIGLYGRLMAFDPAVENAAGQRQALAEEANTLYNAVFTALFTIIAYLNACKLEPSEATRAAQETLVELTRLSEEGANAVSSLEAEANRVLAEVRKTAAESGVSQKASYFGAEADRHDELTKKWQNYTVLSATGLGAFALVSLAFSLYWPPVGVYQTTQIALSKVLIFSTIAFMLLLSSRTLLAHRHNAVVNKHRQNALLTFNALAESTGDTQTREVILTHASACIYAPQETGFTKPSGMSSPSPIIDVMPRIMGQQGHS